mgnify:FL=1
METNDALFNEVLAALSAKKPEKYFPDLSVGQRPGFLPPDGKQYKFLKAYLLKTSRRQLSAATKFTISNAAVKEAVNAMFMAPKDFVRAVNSAIPPLGNMWLEWDEAYREQCVYELYGEVSGYSESRKKNIANTPDTPFVLKPDLSNDCKRVGYHITSFSTSASGPNPFIRVRDQTAPAHQYTAYVSFNSTELGPRRMGWESWSDSLSLVTRCPFSWLYQFGDEPWSWDDATIPPQASSCGLASVIGGNKVFAHLYGFNPFLTARSGQPPLAAAWIPEGVMEDQKEHFLKCFGTKYVNYLGERLEVLPYTVCSLMGHISGGAWNGQRPFEYNPDGTLNALEMIRGDFKFLNTLLALINYDLHVIEQAQPIARSKKTKWLHLRKLPKNELRVIEIDIPKPDGVIVPARLFKGTGSPKRQHTRRGHWSTYHYRDGTTKRKWIGEQLVGNRELGIIEHDYVVKKEQENDRRTIVEASR